MKHWKIHLHEIGSGKGIGGEILITAMSRTLAQLEGYKKMEEMQLKDNWVIEKIEEIKPGRGGKRIGAGSGGKRKGAGRPRKYETKTKVARIPINCKVDALLSTKKDLQSILESWEIQINTAKIDSKTGTYPRTFDKAIKLIEELKKEILNLPIIV
jgi:hypothetical protein